MLRKQRRKLIYMPRDKERIMRYSRRTINRLLHLVQTTHPMTAYAMINRVRAELGPYGLWLALHDQMRTDLR